MSWPRNSPAAMAAVDDATWEDWQRRFADSDRKAGFEISRDFRPFRQIDDIFSRAFHDPRVRSPDAAAFFDSYRGAFRPRRGDGFSQRDFALRNASWALSDLITNRTADQGRRQGFQAPIADDAPLAATRVPVADPARQAAEIKRIARLFGADLVGITERDERWHYVTRVDTRDHSEADPELPDGLDRVIVMGHAMDFDLVETYPSALAGAATGREYSHEAAICVQLAAYIRGLGYRAVASMNDTALVIPYAIKAGLGEYGRNQMVLTPQYGPRVRFSKIFTDLPLEIDAPRKFGMARFCESCTICADACPPKALPRGAPAWGGDSPSTIQGVRKWSANCEKCFSYWAKLRTDCAICMRVCPFNRRPDDRRARVWRWLATGGAGRIGRRLALAWAKRDRRQRLKPRDWWAQD